MLRPTRVRSLVTAAAFAVASVLTLASTPSAHAATPSGMSAVIPQPVTVSPDASTSYQVTSSTVISTDASSAAAGAIGTSLAAILDKSTGYNLPVNATSATTNPPAGIALLLSGANLPTGLQQFQTDQGYRLDVTASGVVIRANTPQGLFAGVQTLREILPPQIESGATQPGPWSVPGGEIVDYPQLAYRAAMLDVARHFHTVADVERYIDQLSLYKINYLHLHLTDDQGWRIQINAYPKLTSTGAATEMGGWSSGFYTQADYQAIQAYANAHYVTVVPEIDMPGHSTAALAAYGNLACNGQAPALDTGGTTGDALCVQAGTPNTTCPAYTAQPQPPNSLQDSCVLTFVDDVIKELAAITTGPYIHLGGDEVSGVSSSDYANFITWAQRDVDTYKNAGGAAMSALAWGEGVNSTLQPSTMLEYWNGSASQFSTAIAGGTKMIMSPAVNAYIDQPYTKNPGTAAQGQVIGLEWAAYIDVNTAYGWNPTSDGIPASAVYGIEAPLWSETVTSDQDIDYLSFPRIPAYAELGWTPSSAYNVSGFDQRLAAQGPRWDVMGLHYYHSAQVAWPSGGTGPTGQIISQQGASICVDANGPVNQGYQDIALASCGSATSQQWTVASDGTVRSLGKCLDIDGGLTSAGTPVGIWACGSQQPNQQWQYSNGQLLNPGSGLCLNATGTIAGSGFDLAACSAGRPQWFTLPSSGPSGPVLAGVAAGGSATTGSAGKCLDVSGGHSVDGTAVDLYDCNATAAQHWVLADDGTIRSLGKCLDVTGGATSSGTKVDLLTCNGSGAQQWHVSGIGNAANGESLTNPKSGLCLDDPGASTTNATQLQIGACSGTVAQVWRMP